MKRTTRLLTLGLFLTVGLWTCQDQAVAPDVLPSFAKGGKKPGADGGNSLMIELTTPDDDWLNPNFVGDGGPVFLTAAAQAGTGTLGSNLSAKSDPFTMTLHFQPADLTARACDIEEDGVCLTWVNHTGCRPGWNSKHTQYGPTNFLAELQRASDADGSLTGSHSMSTALYFEVENVHVVCPDNSQAPTAPYDYDPEAWANSCQEGDFDYAFANWHADSYRTDAPDGSSTTIQGSGSFTINRKPSGVKSAKYSATGYVRCSGVSRYQWNARK